MSKNKSNVKSHPVWVGSIDETVDENTLQQCFKRFGPIRSIQLMKDNGKCKSGYVYFHNEEVAEMAAQEMQGEEINGRKIKTKGPSSNQMSTSSLADLKDNDKTMTDCYYFIMNGTCKPKQGQKCMYRHLEKLRRCDQVCEKWKTRSCKHKNCSRLHPSQKHEQELASGKIQYSRCNSHNAFKCYGQCGNNDCNTHFQTENDLMKHTMKTKSTCTQCNAVFFTKKEKEEHVISMHKQSSDTEKNGAEPIGVFWDIENCQVPKGISPLAIVQKIRKTFYPCRREVDFMCVCDTTKEKKEILEELNKAQINIIHINATSKNAADDKLKQALRRFSQTYTPPATIVLISGDINFISELSDLRHRNNFRVILLHNQQASDVLKLCAHECTRFDEFTSSLPSKTTSIVENTGYPKEVLVTNLPSGDKKMKNKINNHLKVLVDNTGGKIAHLQIHAETTKENTALIRFADAESARRAVTRLTNEIVFGSKITAKLKTLTKQASTLNLSEKTGNQNQKPKEIETQLMIAPPPFPPPFPQGMMPGFNPDLDKQIIASMNRMMPNFIIPPLMPPAHIPLAVAPAPNNAPPSANITPDVQILVEVLDGNINRKDLKKELTSLVREHCKVVSVNIANQNKDSVHVYIKVPKLQDAVLCISRLNKEKLNMKFTLVADKDDALLKMKADIYNLLSEVPRKWMPLNDFLQAYKEKHKKALHVLLLDQAKDLIYIDGKPNAQFICLLQNPIGYQNVAQTASLKGSFVEILKNHNRRVPLTCLPGLYWSYTKQNIKFNDHGEVFIKFIFNPDICLAGNGPNDQVVFYKKPKPKKGQTYPLNDFRRDVIQLLKAYFNFSIPFNRLAPLYHQYFGRQLCLAEFGFKDLNEILNAIPDVVQIIDRKEKTITFTNDFKKILLDEMLELLLSNREKQKLQINSLLTTFYRFFGFKLFYRNFGFSNLVTMIGSLDNTKFKVHGVGENKVLMLAKKALKPNKKQIKKFADEVTKLIQSKPKKQLSIHNLSYEYFKHFGRQLKLSDLGFNKLNDLVLAISDYFEVRGERDQKYLLISSENSNFKDIWMEIEVILNKSIDLCLLGIQLPDVYQKKLKKSFPLDTVKFNQLFKSPPSSISIIGKNAHRVLVYNNPADYPSQLFVEQMCEIANRCPNSKVNARILHDKLKERNLKVSYERVERELKKCDKFQNIKEADGSLPSKMYALLPEQSQRLFERDIIQILYAEPDHKLFLNHLAKTYTKRFGKVLKVADFGVSKLMHLVDKLTKGFVEISHPRTGGQPTMLLGKLGKLCMECDSVMEENAGSLLLCNFAPEYQRKFGKMLRPNDYGFNKVWELVECFSCLMKVYGEKNMKVVVQIHKVLNPSVLNVGGSVNNLASGCDGDGGSDSDVVIENEETESLQNSHFTQSDLLHFTEEEEIDIEENNKQNDYEWWMDTIPNLPEPALQPEPSISAHDAPDFDLDLISFTEFGDDEIRSGGINETFPSPIGHASSTYSSFDTMKAQKYSSDNFVDKLFSNEIPDSNSEEPDLMRMLVGRCSPVDMMAALKPQITEQQSTITTGSELSDAYSMFSPIKKSGAAPQSAGCAVGPAASFSYSQLLGDMLTDQQHIGAAATSNRIIRPRLAANFSKQI